MGVLVVLETFVTSGKMEADFRNLVVDIFDQLNLAQEAQAGVPWLDH